MARGPSECKVYVGDLGYGAAKQELEDVFSRYGPLKNVWIARNPPGFAFVEFEDSRDADDACRGLDGTRINGRRVRVEPSNGKTRSRGGGGGGGPRRGGGGRGGRRYDRSRSISPRRIPRRTPSPRRPSYNSRSRSPVGRQNKSSSRSPDRRGSGRRSWD